MKKSYELLHIVTIRANNLFKPLLKSIFHTIVGVLTCIGCPVASGAAVIPQPASPAAAGAAAGLCASCGLAASRRRREAIDDQPKTATSIMKEADKVSVL